MAHPLDYFNDISQQNNVKISTESFAVLMDEKDVLKDIREQFEYPKMKQLPFTDLTKVSPDEDSIYLCGNSLGLMPKKAWGTMKETLQKWADFGVYGHHYGDHPWFMCDEELLESMCRLVGATVNEVAIMNQLTTSLHFLLLSLYRPTQSRYKILFEDKAFPSDHYAFESQVKFHGLNPDDALILMKPREGEYTLQLQDILETIQTYGEQISIICFSGVQYYTGQMFDIEMITKHGHDMGAYVGWDLAHCVGNIELQLHDWNIDFAVWTTYKYLNAGAGNAGAAFLHSRLFSIDLPYLTGWWGHSVNTRMLMTNKMEPGIGIRKYRMSTPSALHCSVLRASLEIFNMTDMKTVRKKSILLTAYFEYLLNQINVEFSRKCLQIITPSNINERGAQLSVYFFVSNINEIHDLLKKHGVVCDQRNPNIIRMAPNPLYNSYMDIFRTYKILYDIFKH